jgi:D-alanine--D-alanine ligase
MSPKIRVGILYGGQSAEHEISILSARNVLAALDRARFEPVLIGIDKSGRWLAQDEQRQVAVQPGLPAPVETAARQVDVVFPVLHGTLGEDGAMQGLLEGAGIPYVGAGVSSRIRRVNARACCRWVSRCSPSRPTPARRWAFARSPLRRGLKMRYAMRCSSTARRWRSRASPAARSS